MPSDAASVKAMYLRYFFAAVVVALTCAIEVHAFPTCTEAQSDQRGLTEPSTPSPSPMCPYTDYSSGAFPSYPTYQVALKSAVWSTPEDLNAWAAKNFVYSATRTSALLNRDGLLKSAASPPSEAEFFVKPMAIPLDLSFFIVETLRCMDAGLLPSYLRVDFEPYAYNGIVLRRHWLASFQRKGKWFFLGDTRYRGRIFGPYAKEKLQKTQKIDFRDFQVAAAGVTTVETG